MTCSLVASGLMAAVIRNDMRSPRGWTDLDGILRQLDNMLTDLAMELVLSGLVGGGGAVRAAGLEGGCLELDWTVAFED